MAWGVVWFCDLAEAVDVPSIASAMAQALGAPLGASDPVAQLGEMLAGRGRCLVILDNFEQVVDCAVETVGRWLDQTREAQFLVTSRERLGLLGEQLMHLDPLPPKDATSLFITRAQAVRRDFAPSGDESETIATLVALLDHLPLAIERAAARVRMMSVDRLLARMSDRFRLLVDTGDRSARHSTLEATLDCSWEPLAPWEQAALAQISVFEGGFELDDADAIVDLSQFSRAPWTMDVIQSLVDRSLVRVVDDDRFSLLVSVQVYAASRLRERGEVEQTERRHGTHYSELGTDAALDALRTHGGVARMRGLQRELDNLIAACRRAATRGDSPVAVRTMRGVGGD
jgi:predicted ATPase